ncbi:gliding motility-associated C-terminal domain-containing protein [Flavobacterium sp. MMLR14_040]|uniref:T9SS type B sorting domain-containing protein n=1 Tax=Flavobacterium sp. MMLR14_040 TaxID=3093843 RepID=UPI0029900130|nr:gliding motility-associated C-terminal domain-containing protein [Flavobacterium sp. MMLR14_040]MDW8849359.1 gliding motility-associated C-terminal domain-containing protein [Flavobacterium sp. MMLR14_040]
MKLKLLFLASILFLFSNMIHAQNPPVAIAKNITVKLDASGNVTVNAADLDNGSTDNTGIASYMITTATYGTFCATQSEPNVMAIAAPGGSVFTTINFASYGTPNGTCGSFTLGSCHSANSNSVVSSYLLNKNSANIPADNTVFGGDPCGSIPKRLSVSASYEPLGANVKASLDLSCSNIGDNTVTLIVTDTDGNKSYTTAIIKVVDDIVPVITCPGNITVNNDPGLCGAVVTFAPIVTDNCTSSIPVVATFTNAGATGRFGPTQAECDTAYGAGVVTINTQGIQEWKVPTTGKYTIQALGASGGNATSPGFMGGNGASMIGEVDLVKDEIIKIVVGQQGEATSDNYGAGGGGGSFITTFSNTPIMVAGGGGGAGLEDSSSKEASIATTANNGLNGGNGGTALNGGNVGSGINIAGAGGGGFNTNGSDGTARPSQGGFSFLNGSVGGINESISAGGFGGGGGGAINCGYGGGGGGYAGGGPSGYNGGCGGNGGGAGSFNSGANQINIGGANSGMGKVIITLLSASIVPSQTDVTGLTSGSVFPVGTTTLKYTATDSSGNVSTECSFDITVVDAEKPTIMCAVPSASYNNDLGVCSFTVVDNSLDPVAADNCSTVSVLNNFNNSATLNGAIFPVGTTNVIWTATDAAGNTETCNHDIIVVDAEAPVVSTKNITVQLDATGNVTIVAGDVDNGSADLCGAVTLSITPDTFTCANIGDNTVTLTATDASGNPSTANAIVKVEDKVAPIVAVKNITVQLDATGNATIVASDINDSSSDNCGIDTLELDITSFTCANIGTNTVQLKVTDIHGNSDTKDAIVTVEDKIAPIVSTKNITVQLDATGNATITGNDVDSGSADFCLGTLTYSVSPNTFNCTNVGANTVTLTVTDASGNFDTATATVTIEDKTVPIVLTKNISIQFDVLGNASIVAADVDNGSITVCGGSLTLAVSPSSFTCANAGANTVTLTATGSNGEISSETAIVTVLENIAPVAQAQDITVELDEAGNVSVTANQVNNGSSDNCGIDTVTLSKTSFDCTNVGANTVVLTVVDKSGNTATATAKVTVVNKSGDNDNDGILDNCDPDDDNDGVLDTKDNCPITSNPYQEDRNNNGIGDACDKDQMNISEAFTPNGDGINDTWVVSNIENYPASVVRVFNRWGAEVFTARNYQNNWDGHAKGQSSTLPAASSYYYQIDLDGNGTIDRQGWIYINR